MYRRAESLLPLCRELIGETDHRLAPCDALRDYPAQDHHWYNLQQREFERAGCRLLGDYHDIGSTATSSDLMRCFVRAMVSPDGVTGVAIFRLKPPWWQKIVLFLLPGVKVVRKVRECMSYFSDGTSVTTSVVSPSSMLDTPPHESRRFVARKTSVSELLEEHLRQVEEWRANNSGCGPLKLRSLEDFCAAESALKKTTHAFRRKHGGMTVAEIARLVKSSEDEARVIQADIMEALGLEAR